MAAFTAAVMEASSSAMAADAADFWSGEDTEVMVDVVPAADASISTRPCGLFGRSLTDRGQVWLDLSVQTTDQGHAIERSLLQRCGSRCGCGENTNKGAGQSQNRHEGRLHFALVE